MLEQVSVSQEYAIAKPGVVYTVVAHGFDYTTIRCNGKPLCVPNMYITAPAVDERRHSTYEESYDDIIAAENKEIGWFFN